jgi:hypothetical protein
LTESIQAEEKTAFGTVVKGFLAVTGVVNHHRIGLRRTPCIEDGQGFLTVLIQLS